MPISPPPSASIRPGSVVSIVLKADQRTGRQVHGTVAQLLTRQARHPHGIKVRLTDGRVGRVQQIISSTTTTANSKMAQSNSGGGGGGGGGNPWASEPSHGNPYFSRDDGQPQQHAGAGAGAAATYYQQQPLQPQIQHQQHQQTRPQQQQPSRTNDNDDPLANDPNRGEQFERMQAYEANAPQSEDDRNQAQLQKEFPNIDGSLIAAIYNERGGAGLAEVREMLQELNQG